MKQYQLFLLLFVALFCPMRSMTVCQAETVRCTTISQEYYKQDNDWYVTLKGDRYWFFFDIITTMLEDNHTYTLSDMIASETLLHDYEGGKHVYRATAATYTQYVDAQGELHVSATMSALVDGVETSYTVAYGPETCTIDETIAPYTFTYDTLQTRMLDYRELMGFVQFAGISDEGYEVSICYYAETIEGEHGSPKVYDKFCYLQLPGTEDISDRHLFCNVSATVQATDTTGRYTCVLDGVTEQGERVHAEMAYRPQPKVDPYDGEESYREETLYMEDIDITDYTASYQVLTLSGYTEDMLRSATFVIKTNHLAGEYEVQDFDAYGTFVAYVDEEDMYLATAFYDFVDCSATIEVDGYDLTLRANLLTTAETNYNEQVRFFIEMHGTLPRGLKNDAEESIEAVLPQVNLGTDYIETEQAVQLTATDGVSGYAFLVLYVDETDPETVIPEGEYTINRDQLPGTMLASFGEFDGDPQASFYCTMDDGSFVRPMWFLQSGTAVVRKVDGELAVTVRAKNSCDYDVVLYIGASQPQGIEAVDADARVHKVLRDGQLIIVRGGVEYNVLGNK